MLGAPQAADAAQPAIEHGPGKEVATSPSFLAFLAVACFCPLSPPVRVCCGAGPARF